MTIREIVRTEMATSALNEPKLLQLQQARSHEILDKMAAKMNFLKMRMLGYVMHKAYKSMYEKVIINTSGIKRVIELTESNSGNIVYLSLIHI